ncbi:unnamed protein product [Brassicogethes aeneus]|uniref:CCHC-type domain-containing protein n=1 Tax=Brassicogethes aeneus TaxID=1431903 RepID=A0A9P0ATK2_BRAAE|nr:unnamed protein product [Brassicogethes aeneus]
MHAICLQVVGEVRLIKKIKDGLLVEAKNDKQAKRLQSLVRFGEADVVVKTHQTLNYSKGVIYCSDLLNCSVEELKEHLLVEGITDIKRIQTKKDGKLIDTPTHIITFNSPVLPKKINAAFHRLEVRPYIPNPLRCFKCQKFGHITDKCESKVQICTCGQPPHDGTPCTLPIKCVNCSGDHPARSRSCPVYQEEATIQRIKTLDKVTYFEAKRRYNMSKNINLPKSFSDVVKTTAPAASNLKIEDIIKALIPEITKVVTSIISGGAGISGPQSQTFALPSKKTISRHGVQYDSQSNTDSVAEKRKASETGSDTESSILNSDADLFIYLNLGVNKKRVVHGSGQAGKRKGDLVKSLSALLRKTGTHLKQNSAQKMSEDQSLFRGRSAT